MRTLIVAAALLLTTAAGPAPTARAQAVGSYTRAYGSGYNGVSLASLPYSYYAAIPPNPARIYVGYGANDAPFYGRPYGYPSDRWSWQALSSVPYGGVLNRYYYAPVR